MDSSRLPVFHSRVECVGSKRNVGCCPIRRVEHAGYPHAYWSIGLSGGDDGAEHGGLGTNSSAVGLLDAGSSTVNSVEDSCGGVPVWY